ncbi:MarR family winged helix-turn-helix transcriptional regulator [Butyrivibrio sp. MC2013]|uniref:MarR family winged helix-turn-helix transcriptional regulator n=1 Tax=Butyrivibrio sp. MC2013 TaxID=1280686 RepID=UPI0003FEE243|nr:MarR family winged helix-turn-helix transcriptional regulator [Butyrivibrio sp. MC2013]
MENNAISQIYDKLRLHFYMKVFSRFENREATLSTVESFSMEVIMGLGEPTVAQFARAVDISSPNAAHRVKCLLQKGYVEKIRSNDDMREYHLRPTQKYLDYKQINQDYLELIMKRCQKRFSKEDYKKFQEMLSILNEELMPEIDIKDYTYFDRLDK